MDLGVAGAPPTCPRSFQSLVFRRAALRMSSNSSPVLRPKTLNVQAIDVCNSRCVMCNIWKDGVNETMSLDELRVYLKTPFFSEVTHVGITGGEPTLRKDLVELY